MSWSEATFADVFRFRNGKAIKPKSDGDFPAYGSNGLIGQSPDWMYENAIILGRVGAYCGSVELCRDRFWASDNTIVVEPQPNRMDVVFSYYFLKHANLNRHAGGAAQPLLTQGTLKGLVGSFPSRTIQRRVADILSAYDDLIENNTRRIAMLEDMARRLFEEWFIRFRFPGGNGEMPDGWYNGKFGNVVTLRKSKARPGEHLSGRHYVPIECIGRKTLALSERRPWQEAQSSLQTFECGDILFGAMRSYFHKVCVAPFAGITRSTCFVLVPNSSEIRAFATLLAFRDETVAYATTHSKGSTIPYAHWEGSLENMATVIPSRDVLTNFERLVSPMLETVVMMHETQHNLRTTRDLLLPRLISGEIEVRTAEAELETAAA